MCQRDASFFAIDPKRFIIIGYPKISRQRHLAPSGEPNMIEIALRSIETLGGVVRGRIIGLGRFTLLLREIFSGSFGLVS